LFDARFVGRIRCFLMRGYVLNSICDAPRVGVPPNAQEFADTVRLLRLLVAEVQRAGPAGFTLTAESALFQTACRMLDATPAERESTRTALMVLRDLVWRVDSVRNDLSRFSVDSKIAEALSLLDTADIHFFLRQEP
jgi:hypothetical protein